MKPLLALLVLLSGLLGAGASPKVQVSFSPLTKTAYAAALKQQVRTRPQVTYPLKKQGGRISIPTTGGVKVFRDRGMGTDDLEQAQYDYAGYWPQFRRHVVVAHLWERTEWLLVADNGKQLQLYDTPLFGPGLQRFVVASGGIESGGYPNTIQLFQWKDGSFAKSWETVPTDWEPEQVTWTSANTLVVSKKMWTAASAGTAHEYVRLSIR